MKVMIRTELVTKALFYAVLPALVVFSDNLIGIEEWEMSPDTLRKLVLIPTIAGLSSLKGYFSRSYAEYREEVDRVAVQRQLQQDS